MLGKILERKFKFEKLDIIPKHKGYVTYVLVLFCLFEYVVCQQIPLFSIVQGTASYKSYKGISVFHPLLISFSVFYMQYLFCLFISFPKKKKFLNEYIALFIVSMLFQFNRGGTIINLMMSSIMYIASITNGKKLNYPKINSCMHNYCHYIFSIK